jgi:hypothetical protein
MVTGELDMNKRNSRMNRVLRLLSLVGGVVVLLFSIYWSQDGFNFDVAGDAGYSTLAVLGGYSLAIVVTIIQFVFSTNFRELNPSLLLFGFLAYGYSIWTNASGITHWQGTNPNSFGAWFLGFCVDGVPEPLIAWALGESLSGDFVGNVWNTMKGLVGTVLDGDGTHEQPQTQKREPSFESSQREFPRHVPSQHANQPKKGQGRGYWEGKKMSEMKQQDTQPKISRFNGFGE